MRQYLQILLRLFLPVVCAVLLASVVIGIVFAWVSGLTHDLDAAGEILAQGIAFGVLAAAFGIVVALVYGWPLYALVVISGGATWYAALMLGVLPGILLIIVNHSASGLALLCIIFGAPAALLTHWIAGRIGLV